MNKRSERLSHLPKITQLVYGRPNNRDFHLAAHVPQPVLTWPSSLYIHIPAIYRETGCREV